MADYRVSRNIEESIRYLLHTEKNGVWTGLTICKGFQRAYSFDLPVIAINVNTTNHNTVEIGGKSTQRIVQVLINIFANDDGQKLDLKDWIIDTLKEDIIYYECSVVDNAIVRTQNGNINVLSISDNPVDLSKDKSELDKKDRFRHLVTITVTNGQVES